MRRLLFHTTGNGGGIGHKGVVPDDVKQMAHLVLRHRISLNYSAIADKVSVEYIIDSITSNLKTP